MAPLHERRERPTDPSADLLSHSGLVVRELARALLSMRAGERIARVQEYAERFGTSVGTAQSALAFLQTAGAARLDARGRLGTFASALDYPRLWSFAWPRPVAGALPLPYSRRIEGLATGIRAASVAHPLALDLRFVRGAQQRLQALSTDQYDWALVSRFAADTAHAHGFAVETVMLLGAHSYMGRHVLLTRAPGNLVPGMRVGVDTASTDHVVSVRAASRGVAVELVPIAYSRALEALEAGLIDATVWSDEDVPPGMSGYEATPLDPAAEPALAALSEAALVVRSGNQGMYNVLHALLDPIALRHTQHEVVTGERLPMY